MTEPTNPLTKQSNDALHTASNTRAIRYLDTASAYDLWAEVYDTDGNFLQALDDMEMDTLLPRAISQLTSSTATESMGQGVKVVDLGCGTGRNTLRLLDFQEVIRHIVAVDLSPKMLEVARQRCSDKLGSYANADTKRTVSSTPQSQSQSQQQPSLTFHTYDMLSTPTPPEPLINPPADLLISTLVLEHVPLPSFFAAVSQILAPGGLLLLTNMHSEMGSISQAGFVDPKTGDKIRPTSYAHTIAETLGEGRKWGMEVVRNQEGEMGGETASGVKEVKMGEELVGRLGVRSGKWIGVDVWFGGIWRKTREM